MDSNLAKALLLTAIWLVVLVAVRYSLRHAFDRYERRLAERDPSVAARRRTTFSFLLRVVIALVGLIGDIKAASDAGTASVVRLDRARQYQRQAQFRLDFVEAENSTGFHAPQEAARILAESIDMTRKGQLVLRKDPTGK